MNKSATTGQTNETAARGRVSDLVSTYVHLTDDGAGRTMAIDDQFWPQVMSGGHPELNEGRLVSRFDFEQNWKTWEAHPNGEELVVLLRGSVQMLLEQSDGVQRVRLSEPGQFVLISRGVWHTAHPEVPCSMLFVTPGRGTEHRPA
ncbi:MAG TPA: hypothetical protein VG963_20655 [Polyangiaceae bacterium]|nr:hypothetical protein [Polyangiaceae bacterium]